MSLHPLVEPYASGFLDVGDGHRVYWEECGRPDGKPAVAVHGGPGSGCTPVWRTFFDPDRYRMVLFDQRSSGRSTPHTSEPEVDLSTNTTHHLLADMERLREERGIERWLVLGGSWGSTLGLAYAVRHPERVSELVLFAVTTGRHAEMDWLFRGGLARFFPMQWQALVDALPEELRGEDVPAAYSRLLHHTDPEVRRRAAHAWCLWESATPAWPPREGLARDFEDEAYALAFSRLVTHYIAANCWLEDGELLRQAHVLAETPGALLNGRYDFQAPVEYAWTLHRAWPRSDLVIVDDAGHGGNRLFGEVARVLDGFAR